MIYLSIIEIVNNLAKVGVVSSNLIARSRIQRSDPETWVTDCTQDMGDKPVPNRLSLVCNVFCSGSIYPGSEFMHLRAVDAGVVSGR